jgi:hypothetical protein
MNSRMMCHPRDLIQPACPSTWVWGWRTGTNQREAKSHESCLPECSCLLLGGSPSYRSCTRIKENCNTYRHACISVRCQQYMSKEIYYEIVLTSDTITLHASGLFRAFAVQFLVMSKWWPMGQLTLWRTGEVPSSAQYSLFGGKSLLSNSLSNSLFDCGAGGIST